MLFAQLQSVNPATLKDVVIILIALCSVGISVATYARRSKTEILPTPVPVTVQGSVTTSGQASYVTVQHCEKIHDSTTTKLREIEAEIRAMKSERAEDMEKVGALVSGVRVELTGEFRLVRSEINGLIGAVNRLQGQNECRT